MSEVTIKRDSRFTGIRKMIVDGQVIGTIMDDNGTKKVAISSSALHQGICLDAKQLRQIAARLDVPYSD